MSTFAELLPATECDHEFSFGICIDCDATDEDYDPTPYVAEMVTDWADSASINDHTMTGMNPKPAIVTEDSTEAEGK